MIYIVIHSRLDDPEVDSEFLWSLCRPSELTGEGGYYLTSFGSALQYIKTVGIEDLERVEAAAALASAPKTDHDADLEGETLVWTVAERAATDRKRRVTISNHGPDQIVHHGTGESDEEKT